MYDLMVVGGGAAGFFGAIQVAEKRPDVRILILEKSSKLLSKVRISGGGRCNVTHYEDNPRRLAGHYPRGEKVLKTLFQRYEASDVVSWFASKGVQLKAEEDNRMFPVTDSSQTIIDCFLSEAHRYGFEIRLNSTINKLEKSDQGIRLVTQTGEAFCGANVLIAIGGHPQRTAYQWIADAGHRVTELAPSLFTFNDSSKKFVHLMGLSVNDGVVRIEGTGFLQRGPVLITHWGLSGPAVIRLSAWAAAYLKELNYEFTALVSWIGPRKEDELRHELQTLKASNPKLKVLNNPQYQLPSRLWQTLCSNAELTEGKSWGELSNRYINKLIEQLIRCRFDIHGKTTFKEEFVTSGGVDLEEIDIGTMESKRVPNLYLAGEVLNIDGETGGFNFQAAWTTAWIAAQHIAEHITR